MVSRLGIEGLPMLELELAVVLLCKEVLATVDGVYKEDLFFFNIHVSFQVGPV